MEDFVGVGEFRLEGFMVRNGWFSSFFMNVLCPATIAGWRGKVYSRARLPTKYHPVGLCTFGISFAEVRTTRILGAIAIDGELK
jgi:hypothetical protein